MYSQHQLTTTLFAEHTGSSARLKRRSAGVTLTGSAAGSGRHRRNGSDVTDALRVSGHARRPPADRRQPGAQPVLGDATSINRHGGTAAARLRHSGN